MKTQQVRGVTMQDLGQLPLRATVAYAARCARRVRPSLHVPAAFPEAEQAVLAVDLAIQVAEDFARASSSPALDADAVAAAAYEVAQAIESHSPYAAYAAAHAATTAAEADRAGARSSQGLSCEVVACAWGAYRVVLACSGSLQQTLDDPELVADALCADYDGLLRLTLGVFADYGQPLDPSENGPLGRLWPTGAPSWF